MAIELSGCLRSLNLSSDGKRANIRAARAAGFAVDLFCVLEACNDAEVAAARGGAVDAFLEHVRDAVDVVNCTWWSYDASASVLDARGRLKATHRAAHAGYYPYQRHHPQTRVDNTIAQAHKLEMIGMMRRLSARRYHVVWRQRPDYVSIGAPLVALHGELFGGGAAGGRLDYAVPQACVDHAHTDIEALMSEAAADHYSSLKDSIPGLYNASGRFFHGPEVLLDLHMRLGATMNAGAARKPSYRYRGYWVSRDWYLYRCNAECFGVASPCRRLGPSERPPPLRSALDAPTCGTPEQERSRAG